MNRILLLDIDGVLLPDSQAVDEIPRQEQKSEFLSEFIFDSSCCKRVNALCQKRGYKVMLISTWRKVFSVHSELLKKVLVRSGIDSCHFLDNWLVPYRFASGKIHELGFVLDTLNEKDLPFEILLLDDHRLEVEVWNTEQITFGQIVPNAEIGFSEHDYEKALTYWEQ